MVIKSLKILCGSLIAGTIYSAFVWIRWGKPAGIIFGATVAPIRLAMMLYYLSMPAIIISILLFAYGYKKDLSLHVIIGSSIFGVFWFLMVVFSNTTALLD